MEARYGYKGEITIQLRHTDARWSCRQLHANKLRPFVARIQHVGIINDQDAEFGAVEYSPVPVNTQTVSLPSCRVDMNTLQHLDSAMSTIDEFAEVFADSPGLCTAVEHESNVTSNFRPRMTRAYCVPEIMKQEIEKQVDDLLKVGFIVPSRSPMAAVWSVCSSLTTQSVWLVITGILICTR